MKSATIILCASTLILLNVGAVESFKIFRNFFNNNERKLVIVPDLRAVETVYPIRYDGAQVWKIHSRNINTDIIKKLRLLGGEIWNKNLDGVDVFLPVDALPEAKELLAKSIHTYNIQIEDVQQEIDNTTPANQTYELDYVMSWDQYHGLHAINELMYMMLDYFPNIAQVITAGRSIEKRDIRVLRISNGTARNPAIFIDGGMQARDWTSPAAITYVIYKLMRDWKKHPELITNFDWYFLPVLNPDGYEYTHTHDRLWSKNRRMGDDCDGVNLDRNFGFKWGKEGSSKQACSRMYRGKDRFSEPETKALRNIINSIGDNLVAYISVGGYGQAITFPWGDDNVVPDNFEELRRVAMAAARNIRRVSGAEYRIGSSYQLQIPRAGNSADWVMNEVTPDYVYNLLLQDQGRHGFFLPPEFIKETSEEAYEMIRTVAQAIAEARR